MPTALHYWGDALPSTHPNAAPRCPIPPCDRCHVRGPLAEPRGVRAGPVQGLGGDGRQRSEMGARGRAAVAASPGGRRSGANSSGGRDSRTDHHSASANAQADLGEVARPAGLPCPECGGIGWVCLTGPAIGLYEPCGTCDGAGTAGADRGKAPIRRPIGAPARPFRGDDTAIPQKPRSKT